MRIRIFGRGPLAQSIASLAERADHTVRWAEPTPRPPDADELLDLAILAGSRSSVDADLATVAAETVQRLIVVDAIAPDQEATGGMPLSNAKPGPEAETAWIATLLPEPRVVRAFASVPAQAFTALLSQTAFDGGERLAVPLAGDDADAKTVVEAFIRDIGAEPFDLGPSSVADVLEPGGPLWGRALSSIEMLEAVGWLAGDG
jgi:predicted dinucleotide-binding enzyme